METAYKFNAKGAKREKARDGGNERKVGDKQEIPNYLEAFYAVGNFGEEFRLRPRSARPSPVGTGPRVSGYNFIGDSL